MEEDERKKREFENEQKQKENFVSSWIQSIPSTSNNATIETYEGNGDYAELRTLAVHPTSDDIFEARASKRYLI